MACYNCPCSTHSTSTSTATFRRRLNRPKSVHRNSRVLEEYLPSKRPKDPQDWKRKTLYVKSDESQERTRNRTFDNEDQNEITNGSWVTFVEDYKPREFKDELRVSTDSVGIVNHIRGDWAYVKLRGSASRGYVPLSYCKKYEYRKHEFSTTNTDSGKSSTPDGSNRHSNYFNTDLEKSIPNSSNRHSNYFNTTDLEKSTPDSSIKHSNYFNTDLDENTPDSSNRDSYFSKRSCGPPLIVLYDFEGEAEDDLSVRKGELVCLLNSDDTEWLWVKNDRDEEGFVPRSFVNRHVCEDCKRTLFRKRPSSVCSESEESTLHSSFSNSSSSGVIKSTMREDHHTPVIKSSELLIRCNYRARNHDELSVHSGDIVMANLKDQVAKATGWVWVYSPEHRRSGYVPESSAVETLHETKI